MSPLPERLAQAIGGQELAAAADHLVTEGWRADKRLRDQVYTALGEWEQAFVPPGPVEADQLRPLVTGQHGIHHVYSPRPYSAYDDEWDEAFAPTRSLHWYLNDPGRTDPSGHRVSLTEFMSQVKHYLLYSDAVAFELPVPARQLSHPQQLGRVLRLCDALGPLLRAEIVLLVPNQQSRATELAVAGRAVRNEFGLLYPEEAEADPLGPLEFPYDALPASWFAHDLRRQRFEATAEPLASCLAQLDHYGHVFDLHADRADLALLRAMLRRSGLGVETTLAARKAQQLLILPDLARLCLPMGQLAPADIVAIRTNGQFASFRGALRRSMSRVARCDYEDFFDPRAQTLLEIRDELRVAEQQAVRETRQSKWMKRTLIGTTELSVVSGLGAAGAMLGGPAAAASLAAGGFFATKLIEWLRGRPSRDGKVFARHIAVFSDHPVPAGR